MLKEQLSNSGRLLRVDDGSGDRSGLQRGVSTGSVTSDDGNDGDDGLEVAERAKR